MENNVEKIDLDHVDWKSSREFFESLGEALDKLDDKDESYDFTWVGKRKSIIEAGAPINKTLRPDIEASKDFGNTKNMLIVGDNLDALKLLQESYLGKIKMIYTFNIIDEKIIVQEVLDQEKSNLITYNIDSKICENIIETEILTFPEMLNNNEILFHQPNNTWKKYLIEKNAFQNVEISLIDNNNVYPKYYLIDTNEILVQDYDNNFFVLSIN